MLQNNEYWHEHESCSLQFLEFIREEQYFEACLMATIMRDILQDRRRYHEMMLSLCMRRDNIAQAISHCEELLVLDPNDTDYQECKKQLQFRTNKTKQFTVSELWKEIDKNPDGAPYLFASIPIQLYGMAEYAQHPDSQTHWLLFSSQLDSHTLTQSNKTVACHLTSNEVPFFKHLSFPTQIMTHGYFLSFSDTQVTLSPCRFITELGNIFH